MRRKEAMVGEESMIMIRQLRVTPIQYNLLVLTSGRRNADLGPEELRFGRRCEWFLQGSRLRMQHGVEGSGVGIKQDSPATQRAPLDLQQVHPLRHSGKFT